ncbi:MAG: hypothetical protein AVDCRST_MAG73-489, partial [uncultured Thermomicrobiales bacterium]
CSAGATRNRHTTWDERGGPSGAAPPPLTRSRSMAVPRNGWSPPTV